MRERERPGSTRDGVGGEKVAEGGGAGQRPAGEGREVGTCNYLNQCVCERERERLKEKERERPNARYL